MGMGQGMGMGDSGMMARHSAPIPEAFAGLTNPIPADEESLTRGQEIYTTNCVVCHGESGMGDGPSAVSLNPQPVAIAHTSQMMSDAYLFWRITEGGVPFETAMIPYGGVLDEQARWDVINYVRSLGNGQAAGQMMGGGEMGMGNMQAEATMRAEMLTLAVEQQVITPEEAELFELVHSAVDSVHAGGMGMGDGMEHQMGEGMGMSNNFNMTEIFAGLVASGALTQEQVDAFLDIHTRLEEAGLMK
ncbi:MAG: hypothetical protein Fur0022_24200 [Anaerolineales bacterium]